MTICNRQGRNVKKIANELFGVRLHRSFGTCLPSEVPLTRKMLSCNKVPYKMINFTSETCLVVFVWGFQPLTKCENCPPPRNFVVVWYSVYKVLLFAFEESEPIKNWGNFKSFKIDRVTSQYGVDLACNILNIFLYFHVSLPPVPGCPLSWEQLYLYIRVWQLLPSTVCIVSDLSTGSSLSWKVMLICA